MKAAVQLLITVVLLVVVGIEVFQHLNRAGEREVSMWLKSKMLIAASMYIKKENYGATHVMRIKPSKKSVLRAVCKPEILKSAVSDTGLSMIIFWYLTP